MKNGKIFFISYEKSLEIDLSKFDLKLQIVRYTNKGLLTNFIHVPQLAPSERLFKQTMYKWKKFNLTKYEINFLRKGNTGTWFDLYEIAFLKELGKETKNIYQDIYFLNETKERKDLIKAYERLKYHLDNGQNIIAICYCENYKKCHRYIIGKELIKEGYNVEFL